MSNIKDLRENRHTNTPRTLSLKIHASDGAPHILFMKRTASEAGRVTTLPSRVWPLISSFSSAIIQTHDKPSPSVDRKLSCERSPNSAEVEEDFLSVFYCASMLYAVGYSAQDILSRAISTRWDPTLSRLATIRTALAADNIAVTDRCQGKGRQEYVGTLRARSP